MKPCSGLEAVKQALESGHNVTFIVRNPSKLSITDDKLNVVEANVFDADSYKEHLVGHDAVLSCLGFPPQKPKITLVKSFCGSKVILVGNTLLYACSLCNF